ncbi:MAG: hypothetical protein LDL24_06395 [Treponema sp.]|nr:hypothetical protein [Treponema sp.]
MVNSCGGGVLLSIGLVLSCSLGNTPATVKATPAIQDVPAIISQPSPSGGIDSFQANVKVYSKVDRMPASAKLVSQYRMATKIIDGLVYTRLDFPVDQVHNIAARTIVSNGNEMIVLDSASGKVEYRLPVPEQTADLVKGVSQKTTSLFQKIDVPLLRKTFSDLQWDMESNEQKTHWVIHYPIDMLARYNTNPGQKLQSFKLYLDEANGTVAGYEQIMVEEDGTIITTKNTTLYTEKDGVPIPIGTVQDTHYDKPYTIDTSDSSVPPYNEETAPEISAAEAQQLIESGQAIELNTMSGDPSNPDYTEQTIAVYDSIELNTAADILFKVF